MKPDPPTGLSIEYLSRLSHALMTPLSGIVLWCEMLLRKEGLPELAERGLIAIDRGARAQVAILDNLVELGRLQIGSTELERSPVDLVACADEVVAHNSSAAMLREVSLHFERPTDAALCAGDPLRLRTAVHNLVENALDASPAGGHIDVSVRREGPSVSIEITDEGGGIAPDELPDLLTIGALSGTAPLRRRDRLGLGLPVARSIVELHGGSISVAARSPRGTRVTIALPSL
jgi:signal transduction histidine kinase